MIKMEIRATADGRVVGGGGGGYTDPCAPVAGGQNIVLQHGINSELDYMLGSKFAQ